MAAFFYPMGQNVAAKNCPRTLLGCNIQSRLGIKPYLVYFRSVKKLPIDDCKLLRLLSYLTLPRRRAVIGVPLLRQVQTCLLHKIFSAHSLAIHFEVSHSLAGAGNCLLYATIVVRIFAGQNLARADIYWRELHCHFLS